MKNALISRTVRIQQVMSLIPKLISCRIIDMASSSCLQNFMWVPWCTLVSIGMHAAACTPHIHAHIHIHRHTKCNKKGEKLVEQL